MNAQFRHIIASDFHGWSELWGKYTEDDSVKISSKDLFEKLLCEKWISCLVAELDGKLVGFLIYVTHPYSYSNNDVCYIDELYVTESMRWRGVWTEFIATLKKLGRKSSWDRIYWRTGVNNHVAQTFYEKIAQRIDKVYYSVEIDDV